MVGLSFWNFIVRVFTMGIYHFWGKTEVRKRLWSGIRFNSEPLVYTGRGVELFLGFLIVFFLILFPVLLLIIGAVYYFGPESPYTKAVQLFTYILFFYLFGLAVYRAQRYRLARTTWRGIRGKLEGSPWIYAWMSFWMGVLVPFTLGWILPWRAVKLQKFITENAHFGDRAFLFKGGSGPLYRHFAVLWFVSLSIYGIVLWSLWAKMLPTLLTLQKISNSGEQMPTVGIVVILALIYGSLILAWLLYAIASAWYRARMINHFAACTMFDNLEFAGTLQARGLIYVAVTNFFIRLAGSVLFLFIGLALAVWAYAAMSGFQPPDIDPEKWDKAIRGVTVLLTIGVLLFALSGFSLFTPITQARRTGYLIDHIATRGTVALSDIMQGAKQDIKLGEGLAEAFDIDAF